MLPFTCDLFTVSTLVCEFRVQEHIETKQHGNRFPIQHSGQIDIPQLYLVKLFGMSKVMDFHVYVYKNPDT